LPLFAPVTITVFPVVSGTNAVFEMGMIGRSSAFDLNSIQFEHRYCIRQTAVAYRHAPLASRFTGAALARAEKTQSV
jgi:hypothetical protein